MEQLLTKLVDAVPKWFLLLVLTFLVAWFGGLSYIAFFSSRSVEFFPPKIGPDPALINAVAKLDTDLQGLTKQHFDQITFLRAQLAESRAKAAASREGGISSSIEYGENASKYEREIKELDETLSMKLTHISEQVSQLEGRVR